MVIIPIRVIIISMINLKLNPTLLLKSLVCQNKFNQSVDLMIFHTNDMSKDDCIFFRKSFLLSIRIKLNEFQEKFQKDFFIKTGRIFMIFNAKYNLSLKFSTLQKNTLQKKAHFKSVPFVSQIAIC